MKEVFLNIDSDKEVEEFAREAANYFVHLQRALNYSIDGIIAGTLLALPFGYKGRDVVVIKLDKSFEPINFKQLTLQYKKKFSKEEF